jgi:hypothetical protein
MTHWEKHLTALAKCTCCGQYRPVPLFSRASQGERWMCGLCELLTRHWFEREMKRR